MLLWLNYTVFTTTPTISLLVRLKNTRPSLGLNLKEIVHQVRVGVMDLHTHFFLLQNKKALRLERLPNYHDNVVV